MMFGNYYVENRAEMELPVPIQVITSATSGEISYVSILSHSPILYSCGSELLTITLLMLSQALILSKAGPENIPCVIAHITSLAPFSISVFTAFTIVPAVSHISSTIMAVLPTIVSLSQINTVLFTVFFSYNYALYA